jgi:hypothetical protein
MSRMPRSPVRISIVVVFHAPNNESAARVEHEETLARLIQITEERVCKHVATEASVMTSIAQRVDPALKFKASIE